MWKALLALGLHALAACDFARGVLDDTQNAGLRGRAAVGRRLCLCIFHLLDRFGFCLLAGLVAQSRGDGALNVLFSWNGVVSRWV